MLLLLIAEKLFCFFVVVDVDVDVVIVVLNLRNLLTKFVKNRVSKSRDVSDIEFAVGGCAEQFSCQTQL